MNNHNDALSDLTGFAGRLLLAALFIGSGLSKIQSPEGTQAYIASTGLSYPALIYASAVVIEVVAGTMLVIGVRTRAAAAALALFCLISAGMFHTNVADPNELAHLLKNLAIAGGLLQVVSMGSRRWGLDSYVSRTQLRQPKL